ncbi:MAG TPA: LptF/LptG family permease, partial [Magnetospirillaceae bacterium]|nr:LptF/LptG family permease [Magnetospirillaceae bacterium]
GPASGLRGSAEDPGMRNSGGRHSTIALYIAGEFLIAFAVSFAFFFLVFFVNQMLLMAEDILSKRAPVWDVVRLVIFATPAVLALAFPFASLTGALMAAGRLSSDSELLVLQSAGVSPRRIFLPFLVLGAVFSVGSFLMNDALLPLGTVNFSRLYRRILASSPALVLTPHSARRWEGLTIVAGEVDGQEVADVLIIDAPAGGRRRVISARRGTLEEAEPGVLSLFLTGVYSQTNDPARPGRFEISSSDTLRYNLLLRDITELSLGVGPREMSSTDLRAVIRERREAAWERAGRRKAEALDAKEQARDLYAAAVREGQGITMALAEIRPVLDRATKLSVPAAEDRTLRIYRLEYYKKFSIPAGALCFVFLAFPLATLTRRSGKAAGFGIGLLVAVIYWSLLAGGQTLGTRIEGISPFWAMWAPNAFVLAAGTAVFAAKRAIW